MHLHPSRKRVAAAADEDQRIGEAGRGVHISRLGEPAAIEVEGPAEELAKFRIMPDAVLDEHKSPALAQERRYLDRYHKVHLLACSCRSRNSTMSAAICGPESS